MQGHPRNPTKHPFSLIILLCALFILIVGLVTPSQSRISPYIRWMLFVPYAWCLLWTILYTTTGDAQGDMGAGGAMGTLLLVGVDFLILTDAQKELYPVDDEGKRIGVVTWEASLPSRIKWALQLIGNPRGIGWNFEPPFLLEERTRNQSRAQVARIPFVCMQLMMLVWFVVLDQLGTRIGFANPVFSSNYLSSANIGYSNTVRVLWKGLGLACFALTSYARIEALHCALSMIAVGIFNSRAQNWPSMFGSIKDAWTVQRFWGRVWHQSIRRSLTSCTGSVVSSHPYLNSQPLASFIRLCTAFIITGVVHGAGEYMMLTSLPEEALNTLKAEMRDHGGRGACTFFILQVCAIMGEKILTARPLWPSKDRVVDVDGKGYETMRRKRGAGHHNDTKLSGRGHSGHRYERVGTPTDTMGAVGYLWVVLWLSWSVQYFLNPIVRAGVFDPPQ